MRKKLLVPILSMIFFLMTPEVYAAVYQASATHDAAYPTITLSVAIDTDADIWTAVWHAYSYLIAPIPSVFYAFTLIFEDSMGFSEVYSHWLGNPLSYDDTITLTGYTNSGTWTYTHARWEYFFPLPVGFGFVFVELWINLYTGSTQSPGSYGGGKWGVYFGMI